MIKGCASDPNSSSHPPSIILVTHTQRLGGVREGEREGERGIETEKERDKERERDRERDIYYNRGRD